MQVVLKKMAEKAILVFGKASLTESNSKHKFNFFAIIKYLFLGYT